MIPPDVASSLRSALTESQNATQQPQQTQPVAAIQRIADVLGNLVPGQRIMAEIQGMQANGTYRATVGQREITLALPFSAKTGDSLELEVAESDGKLTLAFVANRGEQSAKDQPVSVATSLSNTGRMIGDLLQELTVDGKRAPAAPLNGNQALVQNMPKDAAQLVPVLKQALTESGMFYEAHQARWAAGRLPTEQLRQEPQGKLPAHTSMPPTAEGLAKATVQTTPTTTASPALSQQGEFPMPDNSAKSSTPSGTASNIPATANPQTSIASRLTAEPLPGSQNNQAQTTITQPATPTGQPQATPPGARHETTTLTSTNAPPSSPGSQPTAAPTDHAPAGTPSAPASTPARGDTSATAPLSTGTTANQPPQGQPVAAQQPNAQPPSGHHNVPSSGQPSTTTQSTTPATTQGAVAPPLQLKQGGLVYEATPPRTAWSAQASPLGATNTPAIAPQTFASTLPAPSPAPPAAIATLTTPAGQSIVPSPAMTKPPGDTPATDNSRSNTTGPIPATSLSRESGLPQSAAGNPPTAAPADKPAAPPPAPSGGGIPRDIAPIVQQQLDGLANQNYAWQGQIWPGQNLWWEIGEDPESRGETGDSGQRWQTRLKLSLPLLGDVDARLSLQGGGELSLRIAAGDAASAGQLRERLQELRQQFEDAGLAVRQMRVDHETSPQIEPAA